MSQALEGKFEVKLEFEDDSFELTEAELLPDNNFVCKSSKITNKNPFKMVFLFGEDLKEFNCTVETVQNKLICGKLDKLDM